MTDELILENISLAKKIARHSKSKYYFCDLDELESAAYMGLVTAAKSFDKNKKNFLLYARYKIHYAIIDYLREISWGKFCLEENSNDLLCNLFAHESKNLDLEFFAKLVKCLNAKYKKIIYLSLVEGLANCEIAKLFNLTEARISQILKISMQKICLEWNNKTEQLYELL